MDKGGRTWNALKGKHRKFTFMIANCFASFCQCFEIVLILKKYALIRPIIIAFTAKIESRAGIKFWKNKCITNKNFYQNWSGVQWSLVAQKAMEKIKCYYRQQSDYFLLLGAYHELFSIMKTSKKSSFVGKRCKITPVRRKQTCFYRSLPNKLVSSANITNRDQSDFDKFHAMRSTKVFSRHLECFLSWKFIIIWCIDKNALLFRM